MFFALALRSTEAEILLTPCSCKWASPLCWNYLQHSILLEKPFWTQYALLSSMMTMEQYHPVTWRIHKEQSTENTGNVSSSECSRAQIYYTDIKYCNTSAQSTSKYMSNNILLLATTCTAKINSAEDQDWNAVTFHNPMSESPSAQLNVLYMHQQWLCRIFSISDDKVRCNHPKGVFIPSKTPETGGHVPPVKPIMSRFCPDQ